MKRILLRYLILSGVGIGIAILVLCARSTFRADSVQDVMAGLTDACFVPGAIFLSIGLLLFGTKGGAFDMLAFSVLMFFSLFRRDAERKKLGTFYDYHEAKKEKRKGMEFGFFILVGLVFVALSMLFLVLYHRY